VIRLLLGAGVALAIAIVGTKALIEFLVRNRIGQPIREDGPQGHFTNAGTPTMGGIAIVGAATIGYAVSDLYDGIYTRTGIFVMLLIIGAGIVGFADDWLKVSRERNLGLNKRMKSLGLLTVAIGFAVLMVNFTNVHTTLSFTNYDLPGWDLGTVGWGVWAVVLIVGTTNAVNLTDGLDGLAAGSAAMAFSAFVVIGFWEFRHPDVYAVPHALDLAVIAAAMLGACTGFLWWNANPARIFMGDTGSLAIGAGLAGLALATSTQLLLVIIGGLYVMETTSVMLQVASFRLFGQRRIFRMAPIHHHFELGGWPETTVIIRFWIIAGLCVALGVGLFYADFVGSGAIEL
jgi:phospho-N-acetylmuramoyl-pentapeptide-transferase